MKKYLFTLAIVWLVSNNLTGQSVVFLHHSTGNNLYHQGGVAGWISDYNTDNNKNYQITERSYPNTPYSWKNYPYDYWNLWVNGSCNNDQSGIECLESICNNYDVVVWKHCYPGAAIAESSDPADVASESKTLANYKAQYRALRDKMDELNDTKFIVWTLVPLHRLSGYQYRFRAKEFVDWVKNDWLTEDEKAHPNIYVFDFFGFAAEQEQEPENGLQYSLKYEYEKSHTESDSHPNQLANQAIGPEFARFIVDVIESDYASQINNYTNNGFRIFPNPTKDQIYFTRSLNNINELSIYNILGQKENRFSFSNGILNISSLPDGIYILRIDNKSFRVVKE